MSESCYLPVFSLEHAAKYARELFAIEGSIKLLAGERDLNFVIDDEQERYVFKIANDDEHRQMLDCQHQVFEHLHRANVFDCAVLPIKSINGNSVEMVMSGSGISHQCRILPYIEGRLLSQIDNYSPELLCDLGRRLAHLDQALKGFQHPALERSILWQMPDVLNIIDLYSPLLADETRRKLVAKFTSGFRERVVPKIDQLRPAVIHNDANDNNVLVDEKGLSVISIIDFGDMVNSWLIAEPAIAAAYAMLDNDDPITAATEILRGYHAQQPLNQVEIDVYFDLICMRLCMSVCLCAYQRSIEPDNEYLSVSEQPAWALLAKLQSMDVATVQQHFAEACIA